MSETGPGDPTESEFEARLDELRDELANGRSEFEAQIDELQARHKLERDLEMAKEKAWQSELRNRWATNQCRYCSRTHDPAVERGDPSHYSIKLRCGSCGGLVAEWNACIDHWRFNPVVKPRPSGPHDDVAFRWDEGFSLPAYMWPPDRSWTSEHPSMACSGWCGATYASDEVVKAARRGAARGKTSLKLQR